MPKNLTATDLVIESLSAQADATGALTGLIALVNVDYDGTGVREQFDVWADRTANQRSNVQGLYDAVAQILQSAYLV